MNVRLPTVSAFTQRQSSAWVGNPARFLPPIVARWSCERHRRYARKMSPANGTSRATSTAMPNQQSQDDSRRGAQAPSALALRMALGQGRRHPINQAFVVEQRIDPPERGIPQLVGVGQEHFDQTALPVRSPQHGAPVRPRRLGGCTA